MNIETHIDNAIREGKSITIEYMNYNGDISSRTLSNIHYSEEYGKDYIEGFCSLRNEMRTFKISRIREVDGIKIEEDTVNSSTRNPFASIGPIDFTKSLENPPRERGTGSLRNVIPREYKTYSSSSTNKHKKEGCYIATMVYGYYSHPHVMVLRRFRDDFLLTSILGSQFVKLYYWLSPKLVRVLHGHKHINSAIQSCLDGFVKQLINHGF